jgi:hypothetical protein
MKVDNAESYLIFLLVAIASILAWSNSYAQQAITYDEYTNDTYGVEIKYPSDWEVDSQNYNEGNTRYTTVVGFYSLFEDVNDLYTDNVEIVSDKIPYKKIDLSAYLDETTNIYKKDAKGFQLISSSQDATLAGLPAYKLTWTQESTGEDPIPLKRTEIGTIFEDKNAIAVTYTAEEDSYEDYLPIFNEMVESLTTTAETSAQQAVIYDKYTSDTYGIEIKYPSDWKVNQSDFVITDYLSGVADFTSGLVDSEDEYDDSVTIYHLQPPVKKISLGEMMDKLVEGYKAEVKDFRLVSSSQDATLAGLPAYKLTWTQESAKAPIQLKVTEIATLVGDNKAIMIDYFAAQDSYNNYLPIFNEMVDSFKTSAEGNTPITSTSTEDQGMANISESTESTDTETGTSEEGTETTESESTDTETGTSEFQGVSSPASEGFQSYTNEYFGIRKLLYPDGWSVSENETTIQFNSPSVGDSSQSVYIDTYLPENRSLQDFAEDDYNYYQSKPDEFSILEFKPIKLKGNQSAHLEVIDIYDEEFGYYKELLVSTIKNDLLYVFDYFAPAEEYAKYISTVTNMIKSLDLSTESEVGSSEEISEPPAFLSPL